MWRNLIKKIKMKGVKLGQFFSGVVIFSFGLWLVLSSPVQASNGEISAVKVIELFVLSGTGIIRLDTTAYPNIKTIVHVVDEADLLESQLNDLIKKITDEEKARALIQPYFQDEAFVMRFQRAALAKLQAERYRLDQQYPAAVINKGEGLVLGFFDMNEIVEFVNQQRGEK